MSKDPDIPKSAGPFIVGWYRHAIPYCAQHYKPEVLGLYRVEAAASNARLIRPDDRMTIIPRARKGHSGEGIGQSNIYYTRDSKGPKRVLQWLKHVLAHIEEIEVDVRVDPPLAAEIETEKQAGFQSDPRIRRAVEMRAMEVVRTSLGWQLIDTSQTKPDDYSYQDRGKERYIEVEGSQQSDPTIILTRNEVEFAKKHSPRIELCLVHSIMVENAAENPVTSGGVLVRFLSWNPDDHKLTERQYQCKLDHTLGSTI